MKAYPYFSVIFYFSFSLAILVHFRGGVITISERIWLFFLKWAFPVLVLDILGISS